MYLDVILDFYLVFIYLYSNVALFCKCSGVCVFRNLFRLELRTVQGLRFCAPVCSGSIGIHFTGIHQFVLSELESRSPGNV